MAKKIMFNDRFGLTEAVLSGRKTQTRRIAYEFGYRVDKCKIWDNNITYMDGKIQVLDEFPNPRYKAGEVVAIAQSYKDAGYTSDLLQEGICRCIGEYRSPMDYDIIGKKCDCFFDELAGWNNKLFTRADLMPHHIRITGVKVERLQDISDIECFKEGIKDYSTPTEKRYGYSDFVRETIVTFKTPREAFAALIDKVSGKGVWDSNPYVFVYEFELVD